MVKIGAISPVSESTECDSHIVAAKKKDGNICVCNRVSRRPRHPMRSVEDVASRMFNATAFSNLDTMSGFRANHVRLWVLAAYHLEHIFQEIQTPPYTVLHHFSISVGCDERAVCCLSLWNHFGCAVGMGRRKIETWCKPEESSTKGTRGQSLTMQVPPRSSTLCWASLHKGRFHANAILFLR